MYGRMNHVRHHITGGEHDGSRLDLAIIGQTDTDRAAGGIERHGVGFKQPRAACKRRPEQAMRQFHGIGIGRAG